MISCREDLKYYLECDRIALKKEYRCPKFIIDNIWKYQILMRKCAYYRNCRKDPFGKLMARLYTIRFHLLGQRLGFSMGVDSFGPGLAIVHYGCTVVHGHARIGNNCRIHEGVTIGANAADEGYPRIGNNVYIASGAKIIGNVHIADGVVIGAGAVVVKDICEPNVTYGGVPAQKISSNNSDAYLVKATECVKR